jgi:hypothetical protein
MRPVAAKTVGHAGEAPGPMLCVEQRRLHERPAAGIEHRIDAAGGTFAGRTVQCFGRSQHAQHEHRIEAQQGRKASCVGWQRTEAERHLRDHRDGWRTGQHGTVDRAYGVGCHAEQKADLAGRRFRTLTFFWFVGRSEDGIRPNHTAAYRRKTRANAGNHHQKTAPAYTTSPILAAMRIPALESTSAPNLTNGYCGRNTGLHPGSTLISLPEHSGKSEELDHEATA